MDEAVATTQVTLSKIITVNAVELLSTFPTDLWKQLHGARKQVCWAYLRGRRLHRHGRILCSRSLCLAAWSIVLHATGLMPPERMQLLRAGRHTSAAVRIEPWIRMLSTQAPAALYLCCAGRGLGPQGAVVSAVWCGPARRGGGAAGRAVAVIRRQEAVRPAAGGGCAGPEYPHCDLFVCALLLDGPTSSSRSSGDGSCQHNISPMSAGFRIMSTSGATGQVT